MKKCLAVSLGILIFIPVYVFAAVTGYTYNPTLQDCELVLDDAQDSDYNNCFYGFNNPNSFGSLLYSGAHVPVNYYKDPSKVSQLSATIIQNADSIAADGTHFFNPDIGYTQFYQYEEYYQANGVLHRGCTERTGFVEYPNNQTVESSYNSLPYSLDDITKQRYIYYAPCMVGAGLATSTIYTQQQILGGSATIAIKAGATVPSTPLCTTNCFSNIMFFPGIMGTRLYEDDDGTEKERWASLFDSNQERLGMDSSGYSLNNLYTKPDTQGNTGVTDEIIGQNIYKSFISDLKDMTATTTLATSTNSTPSTLLVPKDPVINDFALIPYDWRLPLTEIVAKGKVVDGKLYYGTSTSSLGDSFIVKELQHLVDTSKSGKVTIIAHSNGGLVTKELIQELKESNNPLYNKIDKVIFVAVPQVGTPEAVLGLLHGHGAGPLDLYLTNERSRKLAENMPMSYNLLPSSEYFNRVNQTFFDDKIISFDESNVFNTQRAQYGYTIDSTNELKDYLRGTDGRIKPSENNLVYPNIDNDMLFDKAVTMHQRLDAWTPATTTEVVTIAGVGEPTLSGISYIKKKVCTTSHEETNLLHQTKTVCDSYGDVPTYRINTTIDGDGTVVVPSALYHPTGTSFERWWVDLNEYNGFFGAKDHSNILEIPNLRNLIKSKILSEVFTPDSVVLQTETNFLGSANRLHYTLHSPLSLGITDSLGNYTGISTTTGQLVEQIPGSKYFEVGDVKMISLPQSTAHTVKLVGYASGTFALDVDTVQGNTTIASTTFSGIPSSTSTIVTMQVPANTGVTASTTLQIDQNGDGVVDTTLQVNPNKETVYDVTPPELKLTFSTSTKDVILSAVDNLDSNPTLTIGTSTITLKDSQNNTTILNFTKLKDLPTKLVLKYNQITRNDIVTTTPNTHIEYDWSLKNDGTLKDLDTKVIIKGIEKTVFNYKKNTNQTTIKNKNIQTGVVTTTTQSGLIPVTVISSQLNLLNIDY